MKGQAIPPSDHVLLHVPGSLVKIGQLVDQSGQTVSITRDVFRVDTDGISCNWLEAASPDQAKAFKANCAVMKSVRTVRASHKIAKFVVQDVLDSGAEHNVALGCIHDPIDGEKPNPFHSLITDCPPTATDVLDVLAMRCELLAFV